MYIWRMKSIPIETFIQVQFNYFWAIRQSIIPPASCKIHRKSAQNHRRSHGSKSTPCRTPIPSSWIKDC